LSVPACVNNALKRLRLKMASAEEDGNIKVKIEEGQSQGSQGHGQEELEREGDVLVERVDILEDGVTTGHEKMDNLSQELKTLLVGMDVLRGFIKGKFGIEMVDRAAINGDLKTQSQESEEKDELSNKSERKTKSKSKKVKSRDNDDDDDGDDDSQDSASDPPPEPKKGKSRKKTKSKPPGIKITIKREQLNPEELTSTLTNTTVPKKRGRPKRKPEVKSDES